MAGPYGYRSAQAVLGRCIQTAAAFSNRMERLMRTAEQLQIDVEQEVRWEPSVRSEKIGVSVRDSAKKPPAFSLPYSESKA